jgi:hypothetical protein
LIDKREKICVKNLESLLLIDGDGSPEAAFRNSHQQQIIEEKVKLYTKGIPSIS